MSVRSPLLLKRCQLSLWQWEKISTRAIGGYYHCTRGYSKNESYHRGKRMLRCSSVNASDMEESLFSMNKRRVALSTRGLSSGNTDGSRQDSKKEEKKNGNEVEVEVEVEKETKINLKPMENVSMNRMEDLVIDRSGLVNVPVPETEPTGRDDPTGTPVIKSKWTPLLDEIVMRISVRGPMTVSEFMGLALSHPVHGYYMRKDVFGRDGDFTTAPEISQLFGEMIGIWCVATWMQLGKPDRIHIVEVGPGRGSLMSDLIRAVSAFPDFVEAVKKGNGVSMVEISPALRKIQQETLECHPAVPIPLDDEKKDGLENVGKANDKKEEQEGEDEGEEEKRIKKELNEKANEKFDTEFIHQDDEWEMARQKGELKRTAPFGKLQDETLDIEWYREIKDVTKQQDGIPMLIIGQELLDALPVHQFEYSKNKKWVEKLVDIDPAVETEFKEGEAIPDIVDKRHHLRFVLARGETPASKLLINENIRKMTTFKPRDGLEVSAIGASIIEDVSKHLTTVGGAALFVDYGENFPGEDSLRGIKDHKFVSPLQEPGLVDLSADVDFSFLKRIAERSSAMASKARNMGQVAVVAGPVTQGDFLRHMGIETRAAALIQQTSSPEEQFNLYSSFKRLVDSETIDPNTEEVVPGMGESYKVMAIVKGLPGSKSRITVKNVAGFNPLEKEAI